MKHRLELISDGIFAIVMTLLVLELKVPEIERTAPGEELWRALEHLSPLLLAYLVTFLLSSVYWLLHTRMFKPIQGDLDMPFFFLNTVLMLAVSLLPFTLGLWEKWHMRPETMQIFLLHYSLIALTLGLQAIYVRWRGWWPADHPKNRLIKMSFTLPAVAIGGFVSSFLTDAPGMVAVPILACALVARLLAARETKRAG